MRRIGRLESRLLDILLEFPGHPELSDNTVVEPIYTRPLPCVKGRTSKDANKGPLSDQMPLFPKRLPKHSVDSNLLTARSVGVQTSNLYLH